MDGFKNSTRVQYMKGGSCEGYAKGGAIKGAAKIAKVMGEFKAGTLHSGSKKGPEVTSKKQATAIAMSEARKAGAKMPMKKSNGGSVETPDVLIARMTPEELAMGERGVRMAQARLGKKKGMPVAPRGPLISPSSMRDIRARARMESAMPRAKGGLSTMPKGK
jgi:hypothetical protein